MSEEQHQDYELIVQAQNDPQKFAALYTKYVDVIYRYIYYRAGQDTETAEELVAEVFTRALKNLPTFSWQGYPYSAYLYAIARSICKEYYSRPIINDIDELVAEKDIATEATSDKQAEISLLWKRIGDLPDETRELLELRYIDDLSYNDIAVIVNKKPEAIRTQVSRTIAKLRDYYET